MIDDADVKVYLGDAVEELAKLPAGSVQCIVTSPPFWALRDYGTATWSGGDEACDHTPEQRSERRFTNGRGEGSEDDYAGSNLRSWTTRDGTPFGRECGKCGATRVDRQIGLEATPEEWAAKLVEVFRECRRVLRDDGTLWVEVGDTYNANQGPGFNTQAENGRTTQRMEAGGLASPRLNRPAGLKPKDLVGAPWMLAFAMRADGWYLRAENIWHRPNPMPESITDRPTKAHSQVFLFAKSARYFYDADAIRDPLKAESVARYKRGSRYDDQAEIDAVPYKATRPRGAMRRNPREGVDTNGGGQASEEMTWPLDVGANARSVWTIATEPTPFAHFATMASEVARRCIAAGTSEHGACSECGAPWRRVVERGDLVPTDASYDKRVYAPAEGSGFVQGSNRARDGHRAKMAYERFDRGWEASCDHGAPITPCVVLDPFMGSGTTALVARRLGRHAVGVELSPAYLEIARDRLSQQSLFA